MFGISTQILWKIYIEDIDGDCRSESVPTLRLTEDCKYLDIFCLHQVAVVNTWRTVFKGSLYFKTITKTHVVCGVICLRYLVQFTCTYVCAASDVYR